MNRFVVLHHEIPSHRPLITGSPERIRGSHWDWMFEDDGILMTWATEWEPAIGKEGPALRLGDHRLDYLEYEGEISQGRGHVRRLLEGTFRFTRKSDCLLELDLAGDFSCHLHLEWRVSPLDTASNIQPPREVLKGYPTQEWILRTCSKPG